ncbi:MAG: hypothetical protein HRU70_05585 [Phycisphaeraceae bacterium]|nr:MAG: hypothetical protein HRU70_05585 [Phycisphaeraceae bacterium]
MPTDADHIAEHRAGAVVSAVLKASRTSSGGGGGVGGVPEGVAGAARAALEGLDPAAREAALIGALCRIAAATPGADGQGAAGGGGGGDGAPDPVRSLEWSAEVSEFCGWLDDYVWRAWRDAVAPSSVVSRPGVLRKTAARFVRGDAGVTRAKVREDLALLKRVVGSTIAAISRAGRNHAQRHLSRYGAEAIEASTPAGWGKSGRCWERYKELSKGLNEESLESEIMQEIARCARELAEGPGASARG